MPFNEKHDVLSSYAGELGDAFAEDLAKLQKPFADMLRKAAKIADLQEDIPMIAAFLWFEITALWSAACEVEHSKHKEIF